MEQILNFGLAGVAAYGAVGVIDYILEERSQMLLPSDVKFALLFIIALLVGFIPLTLSSIILNHVKIALELALSLSTVNTLVRKIGVN